MARRHDGKGPKPLRSRQFIHGFPDFKRRDKLRLESANEIVAAMYDLCLHCVKANVFVYIENLRSSLLWIMPSTKALASLPAIQKVRHDYCQFGTP